MNKWIVPALSAVAGAAASLMLYDRLPAEMAVHFGSGGSPDNWIGKPWGAFLLPALALLIPCITYLAARLERDENKRRRAEAVNRSIMAFVSLLLLAVHVFTLVYNLGYEVSAGAFATVAVGLMFLLVGNIVPRVPQGSMQWPKLPEAAQRKAARFQGRLMMTAGAAFLLLVLLPKGWIFPAFFTVLGLFVAALIGSMTVYTRGRAS